MTSPDILEEAIINLERSMKTLDFQLYETGDRAARSETGGRGGNVRCHICQQAGHSKEKYTVPRDKLFCKWCRKKEHNSNSFCKRQMDKKKKDKQGAEQNRSNSKEDDLNADDGQRITVLNSQSEDEDDLEDNFTSNENIMTQYDTDENDTDDDVTPHENTQVKQEAPPLTDDEDSEDDLNEEPINMERLMDDLTMNDINEKEKIPENIK